MAAFVVGKSLGSVLGKPFLSFTQLVRDPSLALDRHSLGESPDDNFLVSMSHKLHRMAEKYLWIKMQAVDLSRSQNKVTHT